MINLNVDAYGTYARVSAAADIVELLALERGAVSREWAADWFDDASAVEGILRDHFTDEQGPVPISVAASGSLGEVVDTALEAVDRVFAVLGQRVELLGSMYPFRLAHGGLERVHDVDDRCPYLALLWTTALHAFSDGVPGFSVTDFFEDLVESALLSVHLRAGAVGANRRRRGSFEQAVMAASQEAGCGVDGPAGVRRIRAHDEMVDLIARVPWPDGRSLHWMYLVQATCGRSNSWTRKMSEPSPDQWKSLLRLHSRPRVVLAVPHHVSDDALTWLKAHSPDVLVLDRIPLCSIGRCLPTRYDELFRLVDGTRVA